jgi:uncharacterized membrane protein
MFRAPAARAVAHDAKDAMIAPAMRTSKHKAKQTPPYRLFGRPAPLVVIIAYKAAWGVVEIVAGVLILLSWKIIARELVEDPNDELMNWLLEHLPFGPSQALPLGAAVMTFGLAKLLLALGLWFRIKLTRQIAIVLLSAVGVYGLFEVWTKFSLLKLGALSADLLILAYFLVVLPRHLGDIEDKP